MIKCQNCYRNSNRR